MDNPFKVGDKVYHVKFGEGVVSCTDKSEVPVYASYNNPYGQEWCSLAMVSFTPWPAPNHVRPFTPTLAKGDVLMAIGRNTGRLYKITVECETEKYVRTQTGQDYRKGCYEFFKVIEQIQFN